MTMRGVILGLLFCLFIARPLIQMLSGRPAETVLETMLPRTVQELEAGMEMPGMLPATEEAVAGHLPAGTGPARPGRPMGVTLRARVIELAEQDPEHARIQRIEERRIAGRRAPAAGRATRP